MGGELANAIGAELNEIFQNPDFVVLDVRSETEKTAGLEIPPSTNTTESFKAGYVSFDYYGIQNRRYLWTAINAAKNRVAYNSTGVLLEENNDRDQNILIFCGAERRKPC